MKLAIASLLAGSAAAFAPALTGPHQASSTELYARKPFISGNWKLNPQTKDEAVSLAKDISASITEGSPDADVALFVPYVFIESAMAAVGGKLSVGAEVSGCVGNLRPSFSPIANCQEFAQRSLRSSAWSFPIGVGRVPRRKRSLHRRNLHPHAQIHRRSVGPRGALRAPRDLRRDRRLHQRPMPQNHRRGHVGHALHRRELGGVRAGLGRERVRRPAEEGAEGGQEGGFGQSGHCLRAGLGHRHRQGRHS
ncbi:hypothetical protein ACHAWF_001666 [Thalassiosira exigua]